MLETSYEFAIMAAIAQHPVIMILTSLYVLVLGCVILYQLNNTSNRTLNTWLGVISVLLALVGMTAGVLIKFPQITDKIKSWWSTKPKTST